MKALVTGASGGIGRDIAVILSHLGYDLILVARNENKLIELKNDLDTNCDIIAMDLSSRENCFDLYESLKSHDIDILINNAGYGLFGDFCDIDLIKELNMLDLNIVATDILTKLFLSDFKKKNKGYILNVASAAAFSAGPLMSSYYASKAYVLRLTEAIYQELKKSNSNVHISALCPGPVDTNFNNRADVKFAIKGVSSYMVANYALEQMFKNKLVITPTIFMKFMHFFSKILPDKITLMICYHIQKRKTK